MNGTRSHEQKTEKAREGRNKNVRGKRKESLTSSWCRASVEKEHSFYERHPALSNLSAMKDKEGERRHLIDGGLRRKDLRQRRVSHTSSSHIWEPERTRRLSLGTSGMRLHVPISTANLPHPFSSSFSCIFV